LFDVMTDHTMRITPCVLRIATTGSGSYTFHHQPQLELTMKNFSLRRRSLFAFLAIATCITTAQAQAWPAAKAITLIVGYPAGGSVDLVARIIAEPLGKRLGGQIIVDNVGGAGGVIGAQKVVNAAPDGYTLLLGSGSEISIARIYNAAIKYNGETDLTAIGLIGVTPMVFVAGPKTGVKTMDEALALARRNPGKLNFASSGIGTPLHVAGELINLKAGTSIKHVPYRGAAQHERLVWSVWPGQVARPHDGAVEQRTGRGLA